MTIGGVNVGPRKRPLEIVPNRVVSVGYSMAGSVQQRDFALTNQIVDITLAFVSDVNRILLQIALEDTSLPGGAVSVTPDSGDDLGQGASSGGTYYYVPRSFRAIMVKPGYWEINIKLRYIASA